ncbi:IclR family transcriptional regulator [Nocardioides sp. LHD-245]|uniref:IclR family transcriptional regulator n=1 Tax=Nocardioides sp. LHD-245 TaxID=3051387 RepID=UPI0027E1D09E|nr:IclR family transcriptional regulator [Nocardioides sp. LHD-245]
MEADGTLRPPTGREAGDGVVQSSASKALAVLEVLSRSQDATVGVSEVAAEIGVPKSTAHRLLKTLEQHGFVGRTGIRYRVGGSLFELAEAALWSEYGELREVAPKPLNWLFERSEAIAVHLAVLSGPSVLYLDKVTRPAGTRLPSRVGGRFPATCTALGKAMLAFSPPPLVHGILDRPMPRATPYSVVHRRQFVDQLRTAAQAGYAVEREESCQGTLCVAAPVLRHGKAVAAVSLCVPTRGLGRAADQRLGSFGRLAVEAAGQIRELLPAS